MANHAHLVPDDDREPRYPVPLHPAETVVTSADGRRHLVRSDALSTLPETDREKYVREQRVIRERSAETARENFEAFNQAKALGRDFRRSQYGDGVFGRAMSAYRHVMDERLIYRPQADQMINQLMTHTNTMADTDHLYWQTDAMSSSAVAIARQQAEVTEIHRESEIRTTEAMINAKYRQDLALAAGMHEIQMDSVRTANKHERNMQMLEDARYYTSLYIQLEKSLGDERTKAILAAMRPTLDAAAQAVTDLEQDGYTSKDIKALDPMFVTVLQDRLKILQEEADRIGAYVPSKWYQARERE